VFVSCSGWPDLCVCCVFSDLTRAEISFANGKPELIGEPEHIEITLDMPEDPKVKEIVDGYMGEFEQKMEQIAGYSAVELDGRFAQIRTQETNLGNFVCDIMLHSVPDLDIAMLNSGTLRSDDLHSVGPLKLKDLVNILPMPDALCVLGITGRQLLEALNNSVSQYPRLEGRFAQIAGFSFEFDPQKEKDRVLPETILIGEKKEPLDMDKEYKLITKAYLALGKDGYDVFKDCRMILDDEAGPVLPSIVRNYFNELAVRNGFSTRSNVSDGQMIKMDKAAAIREHRTTMLVDGKELMAICPEVHLTTFYCEDSC
jgi:5'-nucleotidase